MNGHSYGISKLTAAHSRELLSEGHRRQLAKTVPPRPRLALREPGRLVHAWASRIWVWPFYSGPRTHVAIEGRPHPSTPANQP